MPPMRGDLSQTPVADLCRGLSAADATGAVEVGGHAGDARIFFRAGDVYWAESPTPRARLGDRLVNAGLLAQEQLDEALEAQRGPSEGTKLGALLVDRGLVSRDVIRVFVQEQILDALFEMVGWHEGTYSFNPGDALDEKLPVELPVDQMLVEVARRQSEWHQIQEVIPDLDMIPEFVSGGSSAHAALEPDEFTVLANVDGGRSIRDLADALGYSEFEAARIVYGLTLLGIVDVRPADEDTDAEDTDAEDTDAEAAAPEPDADAGLDIDVASALEEAVAAAGRAVTPPRPDTERPTVKLHVDDDVRDYLPSPGDRPGTQVPAPPDEPAAAPPQAADDEEPEPWVADAGTTAEAPGDDIGFFAGSAATDTGGDEDTPRPAPLDDDDFDALLSELAAPLGATAVRGTEEEDDEVAAEAGDEPEPARAEEAVDREPAPVLEPQEAPPAPEEDEHPAAPRRPGAGQSGDVSEFLRELSQLAIDEPPPSANPGPTAGPARKSPPTEARPAEPPDAGDTGEPSRDEERRKAAEKREDTSKKRGLFGWGR